MSEFSQAELEDMVHAMSQKEPSSEEKSKIPLLPPGSYTKLRKVGFSPIEGQKAPPLAEFTEKELSSLADLKATIEVVYGKTKLSLKELAALKEGSLLPLDELCDDLVDIYVNGKKMARGEVVAVDGQYGVKIISFTKT